MITLLDNFQIVKIDNKFGVINIATNTTIIPYIFEDIKWCNRCLCLKWHSKWGICPVDKLYTLDIKPL